MEDVEVYLGIGSNLEDRKTNLLNGLTLLSERIKMAKFSSIYETEPWGYADQPPFLNCVCVGTTGLTPSELLLSIKEVELLLGREPTVPWGPRIFDVDILLYGQYVVDHPDLQVPHPRLKERAFVLVPLAEIAATHVHPTEMLTMQELLDRVDGKDGVWLLEPPPTIDLVMG